ncbi:hypothetical protein ACT4D6_002421 [Escherichia coli]|uniref:hypothetical protein n=8 Tax=Enterobacteriaceae TaxID=543 RepID=UPI001D4721B5|nr:hypothetical protein [Escherichia coli]EKX5661234.1 hypothetical protein [Escherichia coli]EKY1509165.1 hypothetical protein [Escherichia coli]HDX2019654.1 hypothetical protein [Escherichia coli]HEA1035206.1 hypothetical protein [Escherichia coli]
MTTITREQALKIIEAADEVISALAGTNEDVHPGSDNMLRLWDDLNDRYAPPEVVRELARIALASLEAEAVMFCISGQNVDSEEHVSTSKAVVDAWVEEWNQVDGSPGEPLYKTMPLYYHAALPAPVVPDEMYWQDAPVEGSSKAAAYATGWNACRAAMLHGKGE